MSIILTEKTNQVAAHHLADRHSRLLSLRGRLKFSGPGSSVMMKDMSQQAWTPVQAPNLPVVLSWLAFNISQ